MYQSEREEGSEGTLYIARGREAGGGAKPENPKYYSQNLCSVTAGATRVFFVFIIHDHLSLFFFFFHPTLPARPFFLIFFCVGKPFFFAFFFLSLPTPPNKPEVGWWCVPRSVWLIRGQARNLVSPHIASEKHTSDELLRAGFQHAGAGGEGRGEVFFFSQQRNRIDSIRSVLCSGINGSCFTLAGP